MSAGEGIADITEDGATDNYRWPHRSGRAQAANDSHRKGGGKLRTDSEKRHKEPGEVSEKEAGTNADLLCIEGDRYFFGHGVPQSYDLACEKYAQSAKLEYPPAMSRLGACFQYGRGVDRNEAYGLYWYRKAAKLKDADSLNALGCIYEAGAWQDIEQDYVKAGEYYQRAVDQGHLDAQTNLGYLYEKGLGVPQDLQAAAYWYRQAAEKGFAKAQNNLGSLFYTGSGVPVDNEKAVEWYRKASAQGNASAMNNLGICYEDGVGVEKDLEKAAKLYKMAAQKGNIHAHNNLGYVQMVQENHVEAAKSFRAAAEQSSEDGMYNLAGLYENGLGVEKDLHMAMHYHEQAGLRGHTKAALAAQRLARLLENEGAGSSNAPRPTDNGGPPPSDPSTSAPLASAAQPVVVDTPLSAARKAAASAAATATSYPPSTFPQPNTASPYPPEASAAGVPSSGGYPPTDAAYRGHPGPAGGDPANDVEALHARCRELERQLAVEQGRTASANQKLESETASGRAQIAALEQKIARVEAARDHAVQQSQTLEQEVRNLRSHLEASSAGNSNSSAQPLNSSLSSLHHPASASTSNVSKPRGRATSLHTPGVGLATPLIHQPGMALPSVPSMKSLKSMSDHGSTSDEGLRSDLMKDPDLSEVVLPRSLRKMVGGHTKQSRQSKPRKSVIGMTWVKSLSAMSVVKNTIGGDSNNSKITEKDLIKTHSRELSQADNTLRMVMENEHTQAALARTLSEVVQNLWIRVMSLEDQLTEAGVTPVIPPGIAISQINGVPISELVGGGDMDHLAPGLFSKEAPAFPAISHAGSDTPTDGDDLHHQ